MADFRIDFLNKPTRDFFEDPSRNICLSGGYGSGKTTVALKRFILLSIAFRKYRTVIGRQVLKDLKATTLKTFEKICPRELIARWDMNIDSVIQFKNGSEFLCMHLDSFDEQSLKGLEVNSIYLDQAEEIKESTYTTMDARIDRWDQAEPDEYFVQKYGLKIQRNSFGIWQVPAHMILTPNPEDDTHWIYRYYHPDSIEKRPDYAYYEVSSTENAALSDGTLKQMMSRDPAWVRRFVHGKWGINEATIHRIPPKSIIRPPRKWLEGIIRKSVLFRILDHGESNPTCCLWVAYYNRCYIVYREYYMPGKLVSYHRKAIAELSEDEEYTNNWADPQIFKETSQKYGGFWSVAKEYLDPNLVAPPIVWSPADNNEMATRNRINELFREYEDIQNPLTSEINSPRIYFVEFDSDEYQGRYGVHHVIKQTRNQRRVKLSEINGRPIFSEERDSDMEDHAYDCLRYFIAMHALGSKKKVKLIGETSFLAARQRVKALKIYGEYSNKGDRRALI